MFFNSYRQLQLISTRGECLAFGGLVLVMAGGAVLVLSAWQGLVCRTGAASRPFACFTAYPMLGLFRRGDQAKPENSGVPNALLLMVLLSALAGHLIETGFSFERSAYVSPVLELHGAERGLGQEGRHSTRAGS